MRITELRQYTHQQGQRDTLIELFERLFLDEQRRLGMEVPGSFRQLGHPDRFVWLRSFPDIESRTAALRAFYDGELWQRHRDAANATLIDSDDVLLLRPAGDGAGIRPDASAGGGLVVAAVHPLAGGIAERFPVEHAPALAAAGAKPLARYVTEPTPNPYPRLPVREGESVFVWFGAVADERAAERARRAVPAPREWLVLQPTARSALR